MADKKEVARLQELAYQMRVNLVKLCGSYAGNIHMGGDMSMSDVLTCLFHHTMNIDPKDIKMPMRDRFILSKGHGAVCMGGDTAPLPDGDGYGYISESNPSGPDGTGP